MIENVEEYNVDGTVKKLEMDFEFEKVSGMKSEQDALVCKI